MFSKLLIRLVVSPRNVCVCVCVRTREPRMLCHRSHAFWVFCRERRWSAAMCASARARVARPHELMRCVREPECLQHACHDAFAATSIAGNAARSKTAVAYIRVSTKTNAEKGGIQRQRSSINSCALGQKVKIVREVCDVVPPACSIDSLCAPHMYITM